MRCDYIAEGVISAAKELKMNIPLIVRLKGTKEAEAKECVFLFFPILYLHPICSVLMHWIVYRMIRKSGLKIVPHDQLDEAAEEAVSLAHAA